MAKKTKTTKKEVQVIVRPDVKEKPRRLMHKGEWLAIGADITMPSGELIKEATREQYIEISKRNISLVTIK